MILYTCVQSIQKQISECVIKSKYAEEYLTVDEAGREKNSSEEIPFRQFKDMAFTRLEI